LEKMQDKVVEQGDMGQGDMGQGDNGTGGQVHCPLKRDKRKAFFMIVFYFGRT